MDTLRQHIEGFVAAAVRPALFDAGEEPLPLLPDQWTLSEWNGRLVIQAWSAERNLVRRIVELKDSRRNRMSLITERFPKTLGETQIADLASSDSIELQRQSSRAAFRERFHLMLAREWPQWRIEEISAQPNLEESLTPSFTRAYLRLGSTGVAVMAAAPDSCNVSGVVPAGLILLDYLRRREKACTVSQLLLYVPLRREAEAGFRAACLNPARVNVQLLGYNERDRVGQIEFASAGNVDSTLPPARSPVAPNLAPPQFPTMDGVERVEHGDGSVTLHVYGLEFARWANGKLSCGVQRKRSCTMQTVEATACEILRVRRPEATDRQHPLYAQSAEGWMESQVRANVSAIDASLLPAPLYGQVPVFSGSERGIIDLLGVDHRGRLAVIELKAEADHELPFQALDYWLRVRKHLFAGDFERLGYFPGVALRRENPRMILVAPALQFHSTSESLLAHITPECEVTRVGLAANWREELRVMFRLRGAERPQ